MRLGRREGDLARAEARAIAEALLAAGGDLIVEESIVPIRRGSDRAARLGATAALASALLDGEIDIAVLPVSAIPAGGIAGLEIAAIPARAEPWEAWVSARHPDLVDLPERARVAAATPSRRAQILHARPDLEVAAVDGPAEPAEIREVTGELAGSDARGDAGIVLSAAALRRTGRADSLRAVFTASELTPEPAQGALALLVRADDSASAAVARRIDDPGARAEIAAERAFAAAFAGEVGLPVAAIARRRGAALVLVGMIATPEGERLLRLGMEGPVARPSELGERLAATVLRSGGREILEHSSDRPHRGAAP